MMDGKALGQQILEVVKDFVARSKEQLNARIDELDERVKAIPSGKDGKDGRDGVDGKDGRDGVDGTSLTPEDVRPLVEEAFKAIPIPKDGKDGRDGVDGKDGSDGKSITQDDILTLVHAAVKGLPVPKDGRDGVDGKDGQNGADGTDGVDGKSVTVEDFLPLFESALAKAMLEHERRATDLIQRCIDRIEKPKDGKNGRDAFDLGDIQLSLGDDERTLTLAFVRGEERVERSVMLTHPIYHGVWREGEFVKGDSVTYGGSTWIATRKTKSKPETDDSWKLCTKRGRDGKDGAKGERGPEGRPGRDAYGAARV
jgi:hypothetical protein